jgi:endonuclease/exonuclease/phosphatase (EEP) superfamily protein YafD
LGVVKKILLGLFFISFQQAWSGPKCADVINFDSRIYYSHFGPAYSKTALPSTFNLLSWNVHKLVDPQLAVDFKSLSQTADLVLFQEAVDKAEAVDPLIFANPELHWVMAKSFQQRDGSFTGVATGSTVQPLTDRMMYSNVLEPFLATPKTALVHEFNLVGRTDRLMVVNLHGINFVTTQRFAQHMDQIFAAVKSHQGPLIIAGDFNTWNKSRKRYVIRLLNQLSVHQLVWPRDQFFELDQIFARGVLNFHWFNHDHIQSSDHLPVLMQIELADQWPSKSN